MHLKTIAIHAGRSIVPATGAVSAPIYFATMFERDRDGGFSLGCEYSRETILIGGRLRRAWRP